ncbi:peptidylprolyl isomerase [Enterococcus dispar]|uniref:Peptidyl-prolyl cis-trans isomerase n=1 Tax=Enterococcus dispar ATCC 51266 TaxID=1139219 RepID=S0KVZ5_9ENTE|nr:cyclophilin type peptidyl-prolyl cis-trans isomerase [Enterococcus dispar ATCC 51266]EOW85206.1 cyclophilin type peptidyl-prolyl cis-trans isomerase [Enterococcus dispar ATCC 51266]OJG40100.1 cyclophilin type peptidyl-prolyl cis-trans isomerase [Enterococcus dispar]
MIKKRILGVALLFSVALFIAGCNTNTTSTTSSSTKKTTETSAKVDVNKLDLPQLDPEIKPNEDLVELQTDKGNIKMKLFPDIAPKAVENFITHAKKGYYDGLTFHRVINDFMIQGGDPKGDGTGGESIWGEGFAAEPSNQLYHIRGALAMAQSQQPNSIGSQFYIVQNKDDMSDGLLKGWVPDKIIDAYKKGGYPSLDGSYTVFGQVIEGMDVVDKIAAVKTDTNDKPETPVKIKTIKILQEAKS